MSCVGFFTPEQLARVRAAGDDPRPVSTFRSPEASASKRRRVAEMARSPDPRVRAAAAGSSLAAAEVLQDADETVRGWVAANPASSPDLLERLCDDSSPTVRSVAAWAQCW